MNLFLDFQNVFTYKSDETLSPRLLPSMNSLILDPNFDLIESEFDRLNDLTYIYLSKFIPMQGLTYYFQPSRGHSLTEGGVQSFYNYVGNICLSGHLETLQYP